MKICILQPTYSPSESLFKDYDPAQDPTPYLAGHACEQHWIQKATAVQQVTALSAEGFDVFFNLCDGVPEEDRAGIEVVRTLEGLGVPFTGATSAFYDPSREAMKAACRAAGLLAPAGLAARRLDEVEAIARRLRFPLFVKHPSSYGSIGLTPASRVETPEALREQAGRMLQSFGAVLVEEFIAGREFTVLVAENPEAGGEPLAYPPVEFRFPPGESFKHFDLKWKEYGAMTTVPCQDPLLAERLKDVSRRLFRQLEGTGYARCDLRLDETGGLFMLEINPNCGIFYPPGSHGSADIILLQDPAGPAGFAETLVRTAFKRSRRAPV